LELLQDDDLLRNERRKTKSEGRVKYQGFSKEDMTSKAYGNSDSDRWSSIKSIQINNIPRKEVHSFDFDGTERSASPELGIRDRTPDTTNDVQDDEFGDFTSARVSSKTSENVVPIIPPPIVALSEKQPGLASNKSNDIIDLLAFDTEKISMNDGSTPVPESKQNNNLILEDIFGSPSLMAPNGTSYASPVMQQHTAPQFSNDLFQNNLNFNLSPTINNQTKSDDLSVNKSRPTPKTWEDLKGKVDIDLDNLCSKFSPSKHKPTLNEMRSSPHSSGLIK